MKPCMFRQPPRLKSLRKSLPEPMDRSGFLLSSAHRAREQDTCANTPNDILQDSAARAKHTRTHDRVCPTTIIAAIGQMGERAQFDW